MAKEAKTKQEQWNSRPEPKRLCQLNGCQKDAIGNVNGVWVCREHLFETLGGAKEERDG